MSMQEKIAQLEREFFEQLERARTLEELEQFRLSFLSRNGKITTLLATIKEVSDQEKRIIGPLLNQLKKTTEQAFLQRQIALKQQIAHAERERMRTFDVTAYRTAPLQGSIHPYTLTIEQIENIFISMGFIIADGPEVETDWYNFQALNIPADHPARDMHDTFWIDVPGMLLRTHTSPVQIRMLEQQKLPIAMVNSGRVYRHEATDASHDIMFMQTEGMMVGTNISIAHLRAVLQEWLTSLFVTKKLHLRLRPSYFPFVEPGFEVDISCPFCTNGCSVCKRSRWIEMGGAGLIHPNVLRACDIDPAQYSGFAFGFGLTRLVMLKYGIADIRLLHTAHIPFLHQFNTSP